MIPVGGLPQNVTEANIRAEMEVSNPKSSPSEVIVMADQGYAFVGYEDDPAQGLMKGLIAANTIVAIRSRVREKLSPPCTVDWATARTNKPEGGVFEWNLDDARKESAAQKSNLIYLPLLVSLWVSSEQVAA